jgi:cysteinyl-tRNA synthetase
MLRLGEDKMSKSLGNIISVKEALAKFSSDAIRLFFLSSHYRSPLAYSEESIASQTRAAERLRFAANLDTGTATGAPLDTEAYKTRFVEAMDDDFNTPRALAVMFDLARDINRGREQGQDIAPAQALLRELTGVLGLTLDEPAANTTDAAPFLDLLVEIRSKMRAERQFAVADMVRDRLSALGVTLEDTPDGTIWKLG